MYLEPKTLHQNQINSMGQKVNPTSFRLGNLYTWSSRWFASKANYKKFLQQDIRIRTYLKEKLKESSVARVDLERSSALVRVAIHSAKPGFIIGRGGTGIEETACGGAALLPPPPPQAPNETAISPVAVSLINCTALSSVTPSVKKRCN